MSKPVFESFIPTSQIVRSLSILIEYLQQKQLLDLSVLPIASAYRLLCRYDNCFPQSQLISAELKRVLRASPPIEPVQTQDPDSEEIWIG